MADSGKFYLCYQADETAPRIELTLSPNASLPFVLDQIGAFLIVAGYDFDGVIDVVPIEGAIGGDDICEN